MAHHVVPKKGLERHVPGSPPGQVSTGSEARAKLAESISDVLRAQHVAKRINRQAAYSEDRTHTNGAKSFFCKRVAPRPSATVPRVRQQRAAQA